MTEAFTPEFARRIIELEADSSLQAEVDLLRQKANEGSLSAEEDAAYKDIVVEAIDAISIIQSKARSFIACRSA